MFLKLWEKESSFYEILNLTCLIQFGSWWRLLTRNFFSGWRDRHDWQLRHHLWGDCRPGRLQLWAWRIPGAQPILNGAFLLVSKCFFFKYFFGVPHLATYISLFSLLYERGLGVTGINPGMTFTSFPSSIRQDSNPRPFDRESSSLPTRPDFRPDFQNVSDMWSAVV